MVICSEKKKFPEAFGCTSAILLEKILEPDQLCNHQKIALFQIQLNIIV